MLCEVKMKKKNLIFESALSLTISALIVKILGVVYKVPLSYMLDDRGMGYFNTAYGIYSMFYILSSSGIPKATTCIIGEESDEICCYITYKRLLKFFCFVGMFFTVVLLVLSPLLVRVLSNTNAFFPLLAIAPSLLFVTISGVCRGYLSAKGRLLPIAISQTLEAVLKLVMGILFARLGMVLKLDLSYVCALAVFGITVGALVGAVFLISYVNFTLKLHKTRQKNKEKNTDIYKKVLKTAIPITVGSLILTFGGLLDVWLIMSSGESLGISNEMANELYGNYSTLAIPMFNLVISLVTPLTVALLPVLISKRLNADRQGMKNELEKCILYTVVFVAPCAAVFYFYSFDILDIVFSSWQSARGYSMLSALALGLVFLSILNVLNTAHEAEGNFLFTIMSLTVTTLAKFILSLILIKHSTLGVVSIPLSTAISYAVGCVVSYIGLYKKGLKFSLTRSALPQIAFSVLSFTIPFRYLFSNGVFAGDFIRFVLILMISGLVYVGLCAAYFMLQGLKNVKMNKKICR